MNITVTGVTTKFGISTVIKTGMLSGSEIAEAERMWIRSSQDELKSGKHYKDLPVKLKLVEIDGLLRCKGRLECLD